MSWTFDNLKAETAPEQEREQLKVKIAGADLAKLLRAQHWPYRKHPALLAMCIAIIKNREQGLPLDVELFRRSGKRKKKSIRETTMLLEKLKMIERTDTGLVTATPVFDAILRSGVIQSKIATRTIKIEPALSEVDPFKALPDVVVPRIKQWWDLAVPMEGEEGRTARRKEIQEWMRSHRLLITRMVEQVRKDRDKRHGYTLGIYAMLLARGPLTRQAILKELSRKVGRDRRKRPPGAHKALKWLEARGIVRQGANPNYARPTDNRKAFGVVKGFSVMLPYVVKKVSEHEKRLATSVARIGVTTLASIIWPI